MSSRDTKPTLPALTGLRFLAAWAIFNVHFLPLQHDNPSYLINAFKTSCGAGVCLFFALSGFILAYSYDTISTDKKSAVEFWINRFSRIYPVYLFGMIWFAPFILSHRFAEAPPMIAAVKSLGSFMPTALLIQSWLIDPRFAIAWNGPSWSVSVEALFYLLFPFIAPMMRGLPTRKLVSFAIGACILSFSLSGTLSALLTWTYTDQLIRFNPLFQLPAFVMGIAIGTCFTRRPPQTNSARHALYLAVGLIISCALISPLLPKAVVRSSLFLPAFGLLLLGLAQGDRNKGWLAHPWLVRLGEASYSFYILQFSVALTYYFFANDMKAEDYFGDFDNDRTLNNMLDYSALLALTVTASLLAFRFVEKPLRQKWRERLTMRFLSPTQKT